MQSYSTAAAQLKDLDLLEQLVASRQSNATKIKEEIEPYLRKASWATNSINPALADKLADEIIHFIEERKSIKAAQESLEHQRAEIKFLTDELRDIEGMLREHFQQARLKSADNVEVGYGEFNQAITLYRKWEKIKSEINHIEQDTTSEFIGEELPALLEKYEKQRAELWERIEEIILRYPDIASLPAPQPGTVASVDHELAESLRNQRDELSVRVRAAMRDYDQSYLQLIEEKEQIEKELNNVKRAQKALSLAKDTFIKLSDETHAHWSSRLNEISRQMLDTLPSDFESLHFDPDLRMTARRKGMSEPLQPANIMSQLSIGTREQLYWLSRMVVSRFLSQDLALPIILDEPFSEADDERFREIMIFVLDTLLLQHQVILFSCHEERHEWLLDRLTPAQKEKIALCALEPSRQLI
jgi:hypothetical protein